MVAEKALLMDAKRGTSKVDLKDENMVATMDVVTGCLLAFQRDSLGFEKADVKGTNWAVQWARNSEKRLVDTLGSLDCLLVGMMVKPSAD